ncbi:MAG: hypothetical protein AAB419_12345, partial [Pseudomonadota bacterium]
LYAKRGDLKRAEAELLLAIEARPDYALSYSNLGDVYRALAVQAYGDATRRNPGDKRAAASLRELQPAAAPAPSAVPAPASGAPVVKSKAKPAMSPVTPPASAPDAR